MATSTTAPGQGRFYKIKNKGSGLYFKIRGKSDGDPPPYDDRDDMKDGSKVKQTKYFGDKDQQFLFIPKDKDRKYYYMAIRHSGKVLQVKNAGHSKGERIQQHKVDTAAHFHFDPESAGDGYVWLVAEHSQYCMQVEDASKDEGALIVQGGKKQKGNKLFKLIEAHDLEREKFDKT